MLKGCIVVTRPKLKLYFTFIVLFSGVCAPEDVSLLVGFIATRMCICSWPSHAVSVGKGGNDGVVHSVLCAFASTVVRFSSCVKDM